MRRHQLTSRRHRIAGLVVLGPLLAACATAGAAPISPSPDGGVVVTTSPGETLSFQPTQIVVQAPGPSSLTFQNTSSLPHNLTFTSGLNAASRTIVEPGGSDQVTLTPLAPGAYRFVCTIHEGMTGTLVVR